MAAIAGLPRRGPRLRPVGSSPLHRAERHSAVPGAGLSDAVEPRLPPAPAFQFDDNHTGDCRERPRVVLFVVPLGAATVKDRGDVAAASANWCEAFEDADAPIADDWASDA